MNHSPLKLSTGLEVHIRPRSYQEWEDQEDARLVMVEELAELNREGKTRESEVHVQRCYRRMRRDRLTCWIKDFERIKTGLSLRDVAEIEKAAQEMEAGEIPLGNSDAGGSGA